MSSAYSIGGAHATGFARQPDPAARRAMAKLGGYTRAATADMAAAAAKARAGLWDSWVRKADPHGLLAPAERTRRAEALQQAHYAKMRLAKAAKAAANKAR